jgi:hypothetical protein
MKRQAAPNAKTGTVKLTCSPFAPRCTEDTAPPADASQQ